MGWRADVKESPFFPQVKGYEAAAAWVEQQDPARLTALIPQIEVAVELPPSSEQMEIEDSLGVL